MLLFDAIEVALPPGWVEKSSTPGVLEFWAQADGSTGLLQVSRLSDEHFEFLRSAGDSLGALTAEMGERLSDGEMNWGESVGHKQGVCSVGRFGFSAFRGGAHPATFLWVIVAADAAFMWTWLGPDPFAANIREVMQVVIEARLK